MSVGWVRGFGRAVGLASGLSLLGAFFIWSLSMPSLERLFKSFFWTKGVRVDGRDHIRSVVRGLWMIVYRKAAANSYPVSQLGFPFPCEEWRFARVVFSS